MRAGVSVFPSKAYCSACFGGLELRAICAAARTSGQASMFLYVMDLVAESAIRCHALAQE